MKSQRTMMYQRAQLSRLSPQSQWGRAKKKKQKRHHGVERPGLGPQPYPSLRSGVTWNTRPPPALNSFQCNMMVAM